MAHDLAQTRVPIDIRRVNALLRKGERAFQRGDARQAHRVWRAAASVAPYDERVWWALLRVLETRADRRVCLENIIAINPLNAEARRLLREEMG